MNQRTAYPYRAHAINLSETFDKNGFLHSFYDKPARITLNSTNGIVSYEWCHHGQYRRAGDKPVMVNLNKLLGTVKTWDADSELTSYNGNPGVQNIEIFESPTDYTLYGVPINEENLQATLEHAYETEAPIWASWFLVMEAITQEQFNMFTAKGTWDTLVPIRWILCLWNSNEIFEVYTVKPLYSELHADLRAVTGISTNELLYYIDKNLNAEWGSPETEYALQIEARRSEPKFFTKEIKSFLNLRK